MRFMKFSVAPNEQRRAAPSRLLVWVRAGFYDKAPGLSPLGFRPFLVGRPEVRSSFAGEPLGLGLPPGFDLGMVAAGQDVRDRLALEQRRPGVLRVLQQPVGKAF